MADIKPYIKPYAKYIVLAMLIKLLASVLEMQMPYLTEIILDVHVPNRDLNKIYLFGIIMIVCAILNMSLNMLSNWVSAQSSGKIIKNVRYDLFKKLESLSARQMDELTISSADSRLTNDTYNVNLMLTRLQRGGARAPIMLLGGIYMMLKMDAKLTLILLILLPLLSFVIWFIKKKSVPMYTSLQEKQDRIIRTIQENITGVRVIKALSKTEYERKRFQKANDELTVMDRKTGLLTARTGPLTSLLMNMGLVMVVVIGAFRVNSGACKAGVIIAFMQYFTMVMSAMTGITSLFIMWTKGEASARRIGQVLMSEEELQVTEVPQPQQECPPHIEFRDVSFSYTGIGTNISHLSFRLEHGQILGILGPTGSGKSTILNLLLRLYDPDEGEILIDGQDIRSIPHEELCSKFGTVFQNDFLMEGSVSDNIRFFRKVDEEKIQTAAEDAQAEFIQEKEGGMEGDVQVRGNNLSGGQKQRLLISRALANDPEILVLDDASSALDYQTDAKLRHSLWKNHRDTTTILVAQRISSLCHANLILFLSDGEVIGAGTHKQLLKDCEEYRMTAEIQMGDGKEEI